MKKFLVLFLFLTLSFNTTFVDGAQNRVRGEETSNLISVDFQGLSLYTVLNVLSMKTGMKLVTDTSLYKKEIMLSLKDVTPEEALGVLMDTYDLYYVQQGNSNIYVIKSKADISQITISKVLFCNYASADEVSKILTTRLSKGGKLIADSRTNSIVVTDLSDSIAKMEDLLKTLDIPTQQVLLEAKIIEINLDHERSIGTVWRDFIEDEEKNPNWNEYNPIGIQKNGMINGNSFLNFTTPGYALSNRFANLGIGIVEGDWSLIGNFAAGVKNDNAKMLSNPKILVLNNQEATIDIVEEIPYMESQSTSATDSTVSTSFKDAGIKLRVKPQINRDGSIILNVSPEQSYQSGTGYEGIPIINTSKSTTTLMLKSGETASIGGLIREHEILSEYKVPILGDIPILGYLFKSETKGKTRTELTIFITAKIVNQ